MQRSVLGRPRLPIDPVRRAWAVARGPTGGRARVDEVTGAGPASSVRVSLEIFELGGLGQLEQRRFFFIRWRTQQVDGQRPGMAPPVSRAPPRGKSQRCRMLPLGCCVRVLRAARPTPLRPANSGPRLRASRRDDLQRGRGQWERRKGYFLARRAGIFIYSSSWGPAVPSRAGPRAR